MVWYPAYLDKEDLVYWARNQRSNLTTGDIPDTLIRMSDSIVFGLLDDEDIQVNYTGTVSGNVVSPTDINNYLWGASVAFALELMTYDGIIHYTPGGIQSTKHGAVHTTFMRMQPMFFLGGGNLENLDNVMPFRSYKQLGQWFLKRYIKRYNRNAGGSNIAKPVVDYDKTARGYGWNADLSFMSGADAKSSGLVED